jgi:hypothetical protein
VQVVLAALPAVALSKEEAELVLLHAWSHALDHGCHRRVGAGTSPAQPLELLRALGDAKPAEPPGHVHRLSAWQPLEQRVVDLVGHPADQADPFGRRAPVLQHVEDGLPERGLRPTEPGVGNHRLPLCVGHVVESGHQQHRVLVGEEDEDVLLAPHVLGQVVDVGLPRPALRRCPVEHRCLTARLRHERPRRVMATLVLSC